eukprot:3786001-Amphidinium_carterae.1
MLRFPGFWRGVETTWERAVCKSFSMSSLCATFFLKVLTCSLFWALRMDAMAFLDCYLRGLPDEVPKSQNRRRTWSATTGQSTKLR